jgi:hypothetical protein
MIDSANGDVTVLPDDPPNMVLVRAKSRAKAFERCIYVYRSRSNWVMTTDPSEPPWDTAVWMVPANQNNSRSQS